jgi:hypothetical protein
LKGLIELLIRRLAITIADDLPNGDDSDPTDNDVNDTIPLVNDGNEQQHDSDVSETTMSNKGNSVKAPKQVTNPILTLYKRSILTPIFVPAYTPTRGQ